MIKISVIICTHNPREDYLRRTLEALEKQALPKDQWELLLIDNASAEPLDGKWDLSWHPNSRHVREMELGLTPARLRGISEARAELLVFVDDDNVLFPDYLEQCLKISDQWPILGAWGGQQFPEFEGGTPAEEWKVDCFAATFEKDIWSNNKDLATAPVGAGVCIRKSVALEYRNKVQTDPLRAMLDRTGTQLLSGGDIDMVYVAYGFGLGTGKFTCLKLNHLIPNRRTTDEYLVKLFEGFGFTSVIMQKVISNRVRIPCLSEKIYNAYKLFRMKSHDKLLVAAQERGVTAGLQFLKKNDLL
jgi:glycosyltransferase involved in cell wall biosynthesis